MKFFWKLTYNSKPGTYTFIILADNEQEARRMVYKKFGDDAIYNPDKTTCFHVDPEFEVAAILLESYEE